MVGPLARMAQPIGAVNYEQAAIGMEEIHHGEPPVEEVEPIFVEGQLRVLVLRHSQPFAGRVWANDCWAGI